MRILIRKFGTTLISRPAGKEAYLAFQPTLQSLGSDETVIVDFDRVTVLTPSWADEFLTPLIQEYKGRVELVNTSNLSVIETLKILDLAS
jgi:hypothetical protein